MTQYGACILSCDGTRLTQDEKALFREMNPFGFILFARHIETADQVRALCAEIREAVGRACLITVDQEGGRVQRFRGPTWRDWRPPLETVTAATDPERVMYLRAQLLADELMSVGVDCNCIPTLDLLTETTHPFLKNRCFGSDPHQIATLGRATAQGLLDGGVVPVMKHMPGHGRSHVDTHYDLPCVDATLADLVETDFLPFKALADLPMGMTAHLVFSELDDQPATLSKTMVNHVRKTMGFDGFLMTDDISMQALSGSLAQRTKAAIHAGCDAVLHCNDTFADRVAVAKAAGPMSEAAQRRAKAAEQARETPDAIDIPAIEAELEALLGGQVYV